MQNSSLWIYFQVVGAVTLFNACSSPSLSCNSSANCNMETAYKILVDVMGRQDLDEQQHVIASQMLCSGGKEVIPILIDSLDDKRIYLREARSPNGKLLSPPSPLTVGSECIAVLYEVVGAEPVGSNLHITDWREWWEENKSLSLAQIRLKVSRQKKG